MTFSVSQYLVSFLSGLGFQSKQIRSLLTSFTRREVGKTYGIYSCSAQLTFFEIESISKEISCAEHEYMNMPPSRIELATPLFDLIDYKHRCCGNVIVTTCGLYMLATITSCFNNFTAKFA